MTSIHNHTYILIENSFTSAPKFPALQGIDMPLADSRSQSTGVWHERRSCSQEMFRKSHWCVLSGSSVTHHLLSSNGAGDVGLHAVDLAEERRNAVEHAVAAGVAQRLHPARQRGADVALQQHTTWQCQV